jgi:hypothetical protein
MEGGELDADDDEGDDTRWRRRKRAAKRTVTSHNKTLIFRL